MQLDHWQAKGEGVAKGPFNTGERQELPDVLRNPSALRHGVGIFKNVGVFKNVGTFKKRRWYIQEEALVYSRSEYQDMYYAPG